MDEVHEAVQQLNHRLRKWLGYQSPTKFWMARKGNQVNSRLMQFVVEYMERIGLWLPSCKRPQLLFI